MANIKKGLGPDHIANSTMIDADNDDLSGLTAEGQPVTIFGINRPTGIVAPEGSSYICTDRLDTVADKEYPAMGSRRWHSLGNNWTPEWGYISWKLEIRSGPFANSTWYLQRRGQSVWLKMVMWPLENPSGAVTQNIITNEFIPRGDSMVSGGNVNAPTGYFFGQFYEAGTSCQARWGNVALNNTSNRTKAVWSWQTTAGWPKEDQMGDWEWWGPGTPVSLVDQLKREKERLETDPVVQESVDHLLRKIAKAKQEEENG